MSISRIAIRRPISTFMVFAAILVLGGFSLTRIAIDLYPDISLPVIAVITDYRGAGPAEVEKTVTEPLEKWVATVNNIEHLDSTSRDGSSTIFVRFDWGVDMDQAANDVRERISFAETMLPDDASKPLVIKFDPSLMPIMVLSLSGNIDLAKLRHLADETIKYKLEQVEDVASVNVSGGKEREIQVLVDRNRLISVDLSLDHLLRIIRAENLNLPAGFLESGPDEFLVRTIGEFETVDQIGNVVIAYRNRTPVYLKDVAQIKDSFKERRNEVFVNGKPGIIIQVQKQSGTNTVRVASAVHQQLQQLKGSLPSGVQIETIFDTSEFINESIAQLRQTAVLGGIICLVVVFLFLVSFPSTLIIFTAIPISILVTFIFLYSAELTLNFLTLGGLALGVGLMVDNAIVVLENIFRHRERGEPVKEAAIAGTDEVGMAIIASTLTTLVVFLSLLFTTGIAGIFLRYIAYTVIFSLSASLIVALTLIPVLSSKYLSMRRVEKKGEGSFGRRVNDYVEARYTTILNWALGHRKTVIVGSLSILIALLFFLVPRIGSEFMPRTDQGQINLSLETPLGTRLGLTSEAAREVEEMVKKNVPEVKYILTQVGSGGGGMMMGFGGEGSNNASVTVKLVELAQRKRSSAEIINTLRPIFEWEQASLGLAKIHITQGDEGPPGLSGGAPVSIDIRGYDLKEADTLANRISHLIGEIKGVVEPETSSEMGRPELRISIDRELAATLGINTSQVADAIQTANEGTVASHFREGGDEYGILVRLRLQDRQSLADIERIYLSSPRGQQISLDSIAKLQRVAGPVKIERKDQQRVVTVSAHVTERSLGEIDKDIRSKLSSLVLPPGFSLKYGGEQEQMAESFRSFALALILAVILVYMVMASQFESLRHPFVIIFSLPFAAIGVVAILFLTGTTFSMIVYIGMIMLAGIVVNNGIVMISYINILRGKGMSVSDAVQMGARRRLRPILMTTFTTVFALLPMALGIGPGAELWAPMARTVIGGLSVSMIFTLIFIPVIYTVFAGKKR
ncbi:MAG: efflux RND transporter permease subunit [bacterium]